MNRFKNVLVVFQLDKDNDSALSHAEDVVKINQGKLHIVISSNSNLALEQQTGILHRLEDRLNIPFDFAILRGVAILEVTKYIDAQKIDLVITEPDVKSALSRFFYGSLSLSLFRKAPCPVWVVKHSLTQGYRKVMISIDPLANTEGGKALNRKLLEIGTSLAVRLKAECYCISAWSLPEESSLRSPLLKISEEEIEILVAEKRVEATKAFSEFKQENSDLMHLTQTELLQGIPGNVISQFVVDNNIDIAILGSVARSGVKGFVIGNTAETIINQIDCSIMAVKPDGFISPLLS